MNTLNYHYHVVIDNNGDRPEIQQAALLANLQQLYPLDNPRVYLVAPSNSNDFGDDPSA